jgi:ribosomal protein S18 acetylase RimI-like enzyme
MIFKEMERQNINQIADLFMRVFNEEPWNDAWTFENAYKRLLPMMDRPGFYGMECYENNELAGMILGNSEQYFDGISFQIIEFCINNRLQKKGMGTALLDAFTNELKKKGISNIFLITSRGLLTEGFYIKKGFVTNEGMILMSKKL